jgi:hypothetical protein
MRLTTKYFFVGMTLVIFLVLAAFTVSFLINSASTGINTFYVTKVNGTPNFSNPGGETFWSGVPSVTVPLIPDSNYPPSGATGTVNAQIAWTNTTTTPELLIKLKFSNYGTNGNSLFSASPANVMVNDTASSVNGVVKPAYNSSCTSQFSSCYGGFYPQDIGFLPLAIGSSYTYPEQASVLLGMSPGANSDAWFSVSYKPKMVMGTSGALDTGSGGAMEMWTWSSNPTDNSSLDTGYPGLKISNGSALNTSDFGLPSHASYAMDGYANVSSYYQLGGLPGSNQYNFINNPSVESLNASVTSTSGLMNPYEVQAKGAYDSSTNSWTVEFVRALTTPSNGGENQFQQQFNPKYTGDYFIAFQVNQGAASETYLLYYGSISFWWRLNFTGTPPYVGYNNQDGANGSGQQGVTAISLLLLAVFFLGYFFNGLRETQSPRFTARGAIGYRPFFQS